MTMTAALTALDARPLTEERRSGWAKQIGRFHELRGTGSKPRLLRPTVSGRSKPNELGLRGTGTKARTALMRELRWV